MNSGTYRPGPLAEAGCEPAGDGWTLVFTRDRLPEVAAGWHICLDVAERLLDGNPEAERAPSRR
ncbi:hypothetical protein [Actinomadura livida]|uniref:Uncharacterized protein n=1 Tax=Actinomadura livida TaxID=79909 RepID=A0A7W7ICC0_9ACTN|nr:MULTISPECIES: hypothetical protein [Actinomadura]MBB4774390.1 hypothetical protein [Actinomadura catellatispora]GGT82898.1 hypothetical protein GCM10010208_01590 [Actinomadura livida]